MSRQCAVSDCARMVKSRGWCDLHYKRWWKHGTVDAVRPNVENDPRRFWDHVLVGDDCWEWQGSKDQSGYGKAHWRGKPRRASRVAYALTQGYMPIGLDVCHTCDNPPCCRPDHLFAAAHAENQRDMARKGRMPFGEAQWNRKLSATEVIWIREHYAAGGISQRELGERFGVTQSTVSLIIRGKNWAK